jgi:hypothetical protein
MAHRLLSGSPDMQYSEPPMTSIPANLAQRILDAARIAAAIHQEQALRDRHAIAFTAGGAGVVGVDFDARLSTDGAAPRHEFLRVRIR